MHQFKLNLSTKKGISALSISVRASVPIGVHVYYTVYLLICAFGSMQLLEEMLDNGFPLATESNILKELIKPPSIVRNVVSTLTGDSQYVTLKPLYISSHFLSLSLSPSLSLLFPSFSTPFLPPSLPSPLTPLISLPLTVSAVSYQLVNSLTFPGEEWE